MLNYKLTIEYDGTHYAGWQRQTSHKPQARSDKFKTIQEELEKAFHKIFQKIVYVEASGRTDTGVHAVKQTAHFSLEKSFDVKILKKALNSILPADIVVRDIKKAEKDFHARFSRNSKCYRYIILNSSSRSAFLGRWVTIVRAPLDILAMRREAKCLIGKHDFKSFQASDRKERNSITKVKKISIRSCRQNSIFSFMNGLDFVVIDIKATGFLRNMVRNIVGTLIDVGRGRIKKGQLKIILEKKDRRAAGPCAPAAGLYLLNVDYEK